MATQAISEQPNLVNVFEGVIGSVRQLVVNARDLHSFLQVGKVFAAWIQERIGKYEFVENEDFTVTVSKTGIRSNVIQKDYLLALDMAKELSMVENNDKGREARRYFIAMEKKALAAMIEPVVEYITHQQYEELAKIVSSIGGMFHYRLKASWWLWAELKSLTGATTSRKIPKQCFEVAQQKLQELHSKCVEYKQMMHETETAFFRQNVNLVPVEMQALLDQLK
ncbi:antA/AntB antirepressor family protein [Agitococcus lubricus]|uniref:Phage anti-repressor protein n=1 Tax=Agitococcus lubricus TaxID=1077255 RepID=A0A2T5J0F7_9GAMM|nr:antA/AntB antirepressor family protein [Agitococcus lubricus]PTQ89795.1 phage anti-repressor protein [Agitococcus lubricus]